MQALVELIAGFIALLAAAVLTHKQNQGDREVRRVVECRDAGSNTSLLSESKRDC